MGIESLLWFFLVCFIVHEFEEIIYLGKFISVNLERIKLNAPKRFHSTIDGLSEHNDSRFAFAVFEEIIVLAAIIALSLHFNSYSFFVAVVIAYELHVLFHVLQSIIIRMYIPAVGSGILTSIYCVICVCTLHAQKVISWTDVGLMIPVAVIFMLANLKFAHYLATKAVQKHRSN